MGDNYNNSNYGSGYGADSRTGGFGGFSASQDGTQRDRDASRDTIHPVNIRQIIKMEQAGRDDTYVYEGVEVRNVTIVARVINITVQTTKIAYKVEDGTGTIDAHQWLDNDKQDRQADEKRKNGVEEQTYVRIIGRIKEQPNRRFISAAAIKPITDMNEVLSHIQEIIYHHFYLTKGPVHQLANAGDAQVQGAGFGGAQGIGGSMKPLGLSPDAQRVLDALRRINNSEGTHYVTIAQQLGMSHEQVNEAGKTLFGNGYIYTPMQDDHWAVIGAM